MSRMKEMYAKVAKDPLLQQKFAEIQKDAEKDGQEVLKKKLEAFAKSAGFEVTAEEFKSFMADSIEKQKKGELSETELDLVAGGKNPEGIINIVNTIIGIGIGCGIVSVLYEIAGGRKDCAQMFE